MRRAPHRTCSTIVMKVEHTDFHHAGKRVEVCIDRDDALELATELLIAIRDQRMRKTAPIQTEDSEMSLEHLQSKHISEELPINEKEHNYG